MSPFMVLAPFIFGFLGTLAYCTLFKKDGPSNLKDIEAGLLKLQQKLGNLVDKEIDVHLICHKQGLEIKNSFYHLSLALKTILKEYSENGKSEDFKTMMDTFSKICLKAIEDIKEEQKEYEKTTHHHQ